MGKRRRRGRGGSGSGSGGRDVDVAAAGAGAGWIRRVEGGLLRLGRVVSTVVTAVIDRLLRLELLQTPGCICYRAYAPYEADLLATGFVGSEA